MHREKISVEKVGNQIIYLYCYKYYFVSFDICVSLDLKIKISSEFTYLLFCSLTFYCEYFTFRFGKVKLIWRFIMLLLIKKSKVAFVSGVRYSRLNKLRFFLKNSRFLYPCALKPNLSSETFPL